MSLSITDLKKGTVFTLDGAPYEVLDYSQKVMGRGGSIVNVRVKSLLDGKVRDKTFRGSERLHSADILSRPVQYLYKDSNGYHFMDTENFEQFTARGDILEGIAGYIREGDKLGAQLFGSQIINIELPKNLPLKVTYTEGAVKGDTSTAITKDATLETGLKIKVPAFIEQGDIISVDTTTGAYRARQKG